MIIKTSKTIPDRLEPAPPAIGKGGNWWAYNDKTGKFTDTGVKAQGKDGAPGKDGTGQYTKTVVDARDLDPDIYYPVTFNLDYNKAACDFICRHALGGGKTAPWMTHDLGFSMDYAWEDSMGGWQGGSLRKIHRAKYGFTSVIPAGDIGQNVEYSKAYIYVRGGGMYYFTTGYKDGKPGPAAVLHTEDYTFGKEPYIKTLPLKTSVTLPETEEQRLERLQNEKANELRKGLDSVNSLIAGLSTIRDEIRNGTVEPRKFQDIQYLLDALTKGTTQTAGGLQLTNVIALSNIAGAITSYLSGVDKTDDGKALAMLKAGVRNFGQSSESESVAIYHDGTAHFGQQYLNGDRLDYKEGTSAGPYMSIGKGVISQTIEQVLAANALDTTSTIPNYYKTGSPTAPDSGTKDVGSFFVQNDNSVVTITGTLVVDLRGASATVNYQLAQAELRLDSNAEIASVYAKRQASVADDTNSVAKINASLRLGRGLHVLSVEHLFMPFGGVVSLQDVQIRQQYSTNLKQALFAASGFRLLDAALKRYFDVDFSRSSSEPFIKIGGGLQVDSINGGLPIKVLAHGVWDKRGYNVKYTSVGNGEISISRIGEGIYYLRYPTSWNYSKLSFSGTANSLSSSTDVINTGNIGFSKAESGRVKVFTGDDSSGNDSDVYFQIILRDFSN